MQATADGVETVDASLRNPTSNSREGGQRLGVDMETDTSPIDLRDMASLRPINGFMRTTHRACCIKAVLTITKDSVCHTGIACCFASHELSVFFARWLIRATRQSRSNTRKMHKVRHTVRRSFRF